MPQREKTSEFDAYLKVDGKTGRLKKYQGKDKPPLDVGSVQEGFLEDIEVESYEYANELHTKLVLIFAYMKEDGTIGREKVNLGWTIATLNLLNTLSNLEGLKYLDLMLTFSTKPTPSGMTALAIYIKIDGVDVKKDNKKGYGWRWPYDKLEYLMGPRNKETFEKIKAFIDKNITPLFEKMGDGAIDLKAEEVSNLKKSLRDNTTVTKQDIVKEALQEDIEGVTFTDEEEEDLPF